MHANVWFTINKLFEFECEYIGAHEFCVFMSMN